MFPVLVQSNLKVIDNLGTYDTIRHSFRLAEITEESLEIL